MDVPPYQIWLQKVKPQFEAVIQKKKLICDFDHKRCQPR